MEYIWAKPRGREKFEKSDSREGESATFVKNGVLPDTFDKNEKGKSVLLLATQFGD